MRDLLEIYVHSYVKGILLEYDESLIKKLIIKYKEEDPFLKEKEIRDYINRFSRLKDSEKGLNKDITKYGWSSLENLLDSQKITDKEEINATSSPQVTNAKGVYDSGGIRVFLGQDKRSCIKYGTGYSWCISARGERNEYNYYRNRDGNGATPYFIFNDNLTSEKDANGFFKEPNHVIVLLLYGDKTVTITNANNDGEKEYPYIQSAINDYPFLDPIKNFLKISNQNYLEYKSAEIKEYYESLFFDLRKKKSRGKFFNVFTSLNNIDVSLLDNYLSGNMGLYTIYLEPLFDKPNLPKDFKREAEALDDSFEVDLTKDNNLIIQSKIKIAQGHILTHNSDWLPFYKIFYKDESDKINGNPTERDNFINATKKLYIERNKILRNMWLENKQ